jgi:hypothetical protein
VDRSWSELLSTFRNQKSRCHLAFVPLTIKPGVSFPQRSQHPSSRVMLSSLRSEPNVQNCLFHVHSPNTASLIRLRSRTESSVLLSSCTFERRLGCIRPNWRPQSLVNITPATLRYGIIFSSCLVKFRPIPAMVRVVAHRQS